ncbi:MAG: AAA family ATPase [Halofilum sp. (in: g-proteobacteria)]|nr:AAA family ATPase [Halofilum sp. (in: g-proteobacteria)]
MKIKSVHIENFRAFNDENIEIDNYTCFIGPNNSGKSTILAALNVFFRNQATPGVDVTKLGKEDFHNNDITRPAKIRVTFVDLSNEAEKDFQAYLRHGQLVLSAVARWDDDLGYAPVKQHGSRLVNPDFAEFFELFNNGASAAALKTSYQTIQSNYPDLPNVSVKADMRNALRAAEESAPETCELHEEENQFYGWSKADNRLRKYVSWIYVPAVKDAAEEEVEGKQTAIGQIIRETVNRSDEFGSGIADLRTRTEREYAELVEREKNSLENLNERLSGRFSTWGYTQLKPTAKWEYEPGKTVQVNEPFARIRVSDGRLDTSIGRVGHGIQRALIMSLLEELSESTAERGEGFSPIVAIEEPELYQHPPQARHLRRVLGRLSKAVGTVLLTTHNPIFIDPERFEGVRRVVKSDAGVTSVYGSDITAIGSRLADVFQGTEAPQGRIAAEVANELNPNLGEMFFCSHLVLVEGPEDVAYLSALLASAGLYENFHEKGGHIVPVMGKDRLFRPWVIAEDLRLSRFMIVDGDSSTGQAKTSNQRIYRALGIEEPSQLPYVGEEAIIWERDFSSWFLGEVGRDAWLAAERQACARIGAPDGLGKKNVVLIAETVSVLSENGEIPDSVFQIIGQIVG